MKRLFIVRHAKSSWDDASLADFDRPLNDRGRAAAPMMGAVLAARGWRPDLIISSPAARAIATAELIREAAAFDAPLTMDDRIYEASPNTLREVAASLDGSHRAVMFVGHNPGIEGFIRFLTGAEERMPTASVADIHLEIDAWDTIGPASGRLSEVLRPKDQAAA
jgi:phosphohistidine phosphatase